MRDTQLLERDLDLQENGFYNLNVDLQQKEKFTPDNY